MVTKGILQDVIEHEMGHVLGLGTLWDTLGLKSGFNYTGANAVRNTARSWAALPPLCRWKRPVGRALLVGTGPKTSSVPNL